jgi:ketosteroid isomerase-like protein
MKLTKDSIVALETALIEAIKTSDVPFIENILHDDLLFLTPNGQVVTKQMDLASHRAGEMVVEQLIPTFEACHIQGTTAVSIVVYDTKETMMGNQIAGLFRYIRTWQVLDRRPQVIAGACVRIA